MQTSGTSTSRPSTISKNRSGVVPAASARWIAFWIVGPSAIGSEKGIPSSITSAPPAASASTYSAVASGSGTPAVTYGTSDGSSPAIACSTSLMEDHHVGRGGDVALLGLLDGGFEVLVAPARQVEHDHVAQILLRRLGGDAVGAELLFEEGDGVGRLQRGE